MQGVGVGFVKDLYRTLGPLTQGPYYVNYQLKKKKCRPVEFKKCSCRPAVSKKLPCPMSLSFKTPCLMSLSPKKAHVNVSNLRV